MDLTVSEIINNIRGKRKQPQTTNEEQSPPKMIKAARKKKSKNYELVIHEELVELSEVKQKKAESYQTKCRPQKLVELINNLNDEQKQAVRDIGFGGMLELKLTKIPHGILQMLFNCFNHNSHMFTTKKTDFLLTKYDVDDIFQLPKRGIIVDVSKMGNAASVEDTMLKNEWREKFGVTNTATPINVKAVHDRLLECNDAGDKFKRMFVLYSLSIFLAPSSNKTLDLKLVKTVEDVERIAEFDWCEYVFREMVTSIKSCKEGGKATLSGCILVLMIAYLHRFDFKGYPCPHTLPLITHWDDKSLSKRVDDEKAVGYLGSAPASKIAYPICKQLQQEELKLTLTQNSDEDEVQLKTKQRYITMKLPGGLETDEQIRAKALDPAHKVYQRMQRDNDLFISRCVDNMRKLVKMRQPSEMDNPSTSRQHSEMEAENPEKNPTEDDVAEKETVESQTLPFMKDAQYHYFTDMLAARAYEFQKAKNGLPSFDIWTDVLKIQYKQLHERYGGCTDKDLMESGDESDCNTEKQNEDGNVTNLNSDDDRQDNDFASRLNDLVGNITEKFVAKGNEEFNNKTTWNEEEVEKEIQNMNNDPGVFTQMGEIVLDCDPKVLTQLGKDGDALNDKGIEKEEKGEEKGEAYGDGLHDKSIEKETEGEEEDNGTNEKEIEKEGDDKVHEMNEDNNVAMQLKDVVPDAVLDRTKISNISDYLLHSTVIPHSADILPANLGCALNCGLPHTSSDLVSEFMIERAQYFDVVLQNRKEVMDYCFLTDHTFSKNEIVCDFGIYHCIPRSDIETLLPDTKIEGVVIECWAILLNEFDMARKDGNKKSRIFYGLSCALDTCGENFRHK